MLCFICVRAQFREAALYKIRFPGKPPFGAGASISGVKFSVSFSWVMPQILAYWLYMLMSGRLFKSLNTLTLLNLLTPVKKAKWIWSSQDLISPKKALRVFYQCKRNCCFCAFQNFCMPMGRFCKVFIPLLYYRKLF